MSKPSELHTKRTSRALILICLLPFALTLIPSLGYSAVVILEWSANGEADIGGYIVYYGTSSRNYSTSIDVGNYTSCAISDAGFQEGATYYFALTAYDQFGNESDFSEEVVYTFLPADADGDGISDDDELTIYGTNPEKVDTDDDGINDGDELSYWGDDWDADYDDDGKINLLDRDSDGDGYSDGRELYKGSDPSDPASAPPANIMPVVIQLLLD